MIKTSLCSRNTMIALVCSDCSCLNPIVAAAQSMSILSFSFTSILVVYVISVDDITQSDWHVCFLAAETKVSSAWHQTLSLWFESGS